MNSNCIEIKEKQNNFLLKGVVWLTFSLLSLLLFFLPFISDFAQENRIVFFVIGGICFIYFIFMFVMLLIKEVKPSNAIILDSKGFKLCNQLGNDILIDWANVTSIGIYGTVKEPVFGIKLENTDMVIASLRKKAADEMRENIAENLPAILICQNEIRMPLNELKSVFNKFIRDSRAFDHIETNTHKENPFKSEDVIRAFGGSEEDIQAMRNKNSQSMDSDTEQKAELNTEEPKVQNTVSKTESASDEFYNSLMKKASEKEHKPESPVSNVNDFGNQNHIDDNKNPDDNDKNKDEQDTISDDFKDLLSNVKLNKINEIEKILSSDEVPYSAAKTVAGVASSVEKGSQERSKESLQSDTEEENINTSVQEKNIQETTKMPDLNIDSETEKNTDDSVPQKAENDVSSIQDSNFPSAEEISEDTKNEEKQEKDKCSLNEGESLKPASESPSKDILNNKNIKSAITEEYPSIVIIDDDEDEDDDKIKRGESKNSRGRKKSKKKSSKQNPVDLFKVLDISEDDEDN